MQESYWTYEDFQLQVHTHTTPFDVRKTENGVSMIMTYYM